MNPKIKKFIETNIILIEGNNWEEIYKKLIDEFDYYRSIGEFTSLMLNAGIDPLKYMSVTPPGYAYGANLTNLKIPNNIKNVGFHSFEGNLFNTITIPKSVSIINRGAFRDNPQLKTVYLTKGVTIIRQNAFSLCPTLKDIEFDGTKQEWQNIEKEYNWVTRYYPKKGDIIIHCNDGDIKI